MMKNKSLCGLMALSGLLASCDKSESSISPYITVNSALVNDTLKVDQRFMLSVDLSIADDSGLKDYHIRINDSIYESVPISGNACTFHLDTAFRNSGLYKFSLFATNSKGLESVYYIPILSDSVLRPTVNVFDDAGLRFKADSVIAKGSVLTFTISAYRRELPLERLCIANSINTDSVKYELTQSPYNTDSIVVKYISPAINEESVFSFSAFDSVGLESKSYLKVKVK